MKLSYWLTSLAWRIFLLFGLLAFFVLFGVQALPASAGAPSYVRLIQASPDVGTVDIFVDGAKFLGNERFASVAHLAIQRLLAWSLAEKIETGA